MLDELLEDPRIAAAIKRWYPGKVVNILDARRKTRILDPAIPSLLAKLKEPTFVTINWTDFWPHRRTYRHDGYCIICLKLPGDKMQEVPRALCDVLKEFPAKSDRLGKMLLVGRDAIEVFPPE